MPKFHDTILLVHASRLINAEEFVLLYDLHKPKNPDLPYTNYECFDLDKMTDDECKTLPSEWGKHTIKVGRTLSNENSHELLKNV